MLHDLVQRGRALATDARDAPRASGSGERTLLGEVLAALELDALDLDLLGLALATHFDATALARITAVADEAALTLAAAVQLLGHHPGVRDLPRRCLVDSTLRRAVLLDVVMPAPGISWLQARLVPSPRLLALGAGRVELAASLADVASLVPAPRTAADGVATDPSIDELAALARALQNTQRQRGPLAIIGEPQTGRLRTALAIAARTGRLHVIVVDARLVAAATTAWRTLARQLVAEAAQHVAPIVLRDPGPVGIAAAWRIAREGVPCMFTTTDDGADGDARVIARVARATGVTQDAAWSAELQPGAAHARPTAGASQPPLTRSEIATAAAMADHPPPGRPPEAWFAACVHSQLRSRLDRFARTIHRRARLDDVVLAEDVRAQLLEFVAALRARPRLAEVWDLGRVLDGRAGVAGLFEGPPGTGKTMSAVVVATELDVPLFRIDVSSIVDRYVGETEKNLQRVFREAETTRGILLFDEADSLFARRVETKDAMDRFANMQVNQLLNLIDEHQGISILTTNLSQGLDVAFARRIPYKIRFELPECPERIALWRMYLPPGRLDATAIEELAERYDRVSGADIRNAVIRAAAQAIDTATLTTKILSDALVSEINASGRVARSAR